jgi:opacity protein-like surface antigen
MIRTLVLAASLAAVAAPAAAEVVEQTDDGFTTRNTVEVTASPYETWQALLAPGRWWEDSHTWSGDSDSMYISAQGGGCFCELLPAPEGAPEGVRRGSALHMVVLQANPPSVLRMRGALGPLQSEPVDGVLTITISESGENTKIVWDYVVGGHMRFEVPTIAKAVDGVMAAQLRGLAKVLGPAKAATAAPAAPAAPAEADEAAAEEPAAPARPSVDEAFGDLGDDE